MKRTERLLREKTSRLVWLTAWGFTTDDALESARRSCTQNKTRALTGIVLPRDVRCVAQERRIDGGVEAMVV